MEVTEPAQFPRTLLEPGAVLGAYRLLREVDRTPLTTAFEAREENSGRTVMVRLPAFANAADPSVAARLRREAEILKALNHPGLLHLINEGPLSRPYLVMEWFPGESLRRLIAAGALPPQRAIALTLRIAEPLAYLHNRGIVVRDLNPAHILVGEHDTIKLTEIEAAAKAGAQRLTFASVRQLLLATAYTAPEELSGGRGDERSDVYALGAILYEMLTARLPFEQASLAERVQRSPSFPNPHAAALPAQLQQVVLRALQPEPRRRYASVRDLMHDLMHLDELTAPERVAPRAAKRQLHPLLRRALLYAAALLLPVLIFLLMLASLRRG